jgi:hypothetical protein
MKNFKRQTEVEEQRDPGKSIESRNLGILARLAKAQEANPSITIEDLGTSKLKLREGDDREKIIQGVREAAAKLSPFTVVENHIDPATTILVVNPIESIELSPELQAGLNQIRKDFDSLPKLHLGIEWGVVERSLRADPATLAQLIEDNKLGLSMNVFGEENGELHFASAWRDNRKVNKSLINITYHNAVDIAKRLGATLSPRSINEQLIVGIDDVLYGWWLYETDELILGLGYAIIGLQNGVFCEDSPLDQD